MKKVLCLLGLLVPASLMAQSPAEVTVTGSVTDESDKKNLAFATVSVKSVRDSSIVTSGLSSESGRFTLTMPRGSYFLHIDYVGYESRDFSLPDLTDADKETDLGSFALATNSVTLQEVQVRAEKSQMEFELDKRVFNVGKDLTNGGNTAADILDKVPSVNVDPEGNLTLRGSSGVQILVNGKPSGLLNAGDTEALMRMQGDMIDQIEVITNPSARYEAEGEAGIINIILKKNQAGGFNGSFGLNTGVPHNHGASYNLNYRKNDFNFFSNFGLDYRRGPGFGRSTQEFYEGENLLSSYNVLEDNLRGGLGGYVQFGSDWIWNEYNTLTGSVLLKRARDTNNSEVIYEDFNGLFYSETVRDVLETESERNIEGSLLYKRTFDKPKHEFNATFKYIFDKELELADYEETTGMTADPLFQNSSNTEDEVITLIQADYVYPFSEEGRFETGVRANLRTIDNAYSVNELRDGVPVTLDEFDDQLAYQENIYAAYVIAAQKFNKLSIQAGLRGELSDIDARLLKSGENNDQNYFNLFPSSTFSLQLNPKNQLQLSYSRRLSRPFFRRLLPFSNFNNPRNNSIGNPGLRPEYTHSIEYGWLNYPENGTFLAGVYYRHTTGVIETLTLPSDDGTTIRYPVNLSERKAYGLELNYSVNPVKWMDISSDVNFFRAMVRGNFEGRNLSSDTYTMSGRVSSKLRAGEKTQFQTSFFYRAPANTTQGRDLAIASLDLAGSVEVFQNKGTLTLSCRDLLNTRKRRTVVDLPEFRSEGVFQWWQARSLVLSFNYRLNQSKKRNAAPLDDMDEGEF